jgi:hypothetical protein
MKGFMQGAIRSLLGAVVICCSVSGLATAAPKRKKPRPPVPTAPAPTAPTASDDGFKHGLQLAAANVEALLTDSSSGLRVIVGTGLYEYAPGPGLLIDRIPSATAPADQGEATESHLHGLRQLNGALRTALLSLAGTQWKLELRSFQAGVVNFDVDVNGRRHACTFTVSPDKLERAIDATCRASDGPSPQQGQ